MTLKYHIVIGLEKTNLKAYFPETFRYNQTVIS